MYVYIYMYIHTSLLCIFVWPKMGIINKQVKQRTTEDLGHYLNIGNLFDNRTWIDSHKSLVWEDISKNPKYSSLCGYDQLRIPDGMFFHELSPS